MADVLSPEEDSYFSSSTLRRSHSQPKFITKQFSRSPSALRSKSSAGFGSLIHSPDSTISSTESSPETIHADSAAPSIVSTPASSWTLDPRDEEEEEPEEDAQILFPSYDKPYLHAHPEAEDLEPPLSPRTGDSYTVSPTSNDDESADASSPGSPNIVDHAEDDSAVRKHPSRHVDYLSHNWKEEDIWSSWKLIVSKRKAYNNSARLENASWRTWMKAKNKLKTVSPETLNWLKDCDVTWLYGPLQTGSDKNLRIPSASNSPYGSSRISKSNSFLINKKPILKKRTMSEIMLQRSISSSSLLKQAAAAVQAQQSERPALSRATSDFSHMIHARRLSRENHPTLLSSLSSSGLHSPYPGERKHISFNEQVEQCIAIDGKADDDEEPDHSAIYEDSDSEDDGLMMMRSNSGRKHPSIARSATPKPGSSANNKTIELLPNTTLKYRGDTPEPSETAMKHSSGFWNGSKLSPSPSQETLRPSRPSTRLLLGDDDEDDVDMDWQPPNAYANRKDSMAVTQERYNGLASSGSSSSLNGEPSGMRRTPSGMFMPYEEDEDDVVSEGLFGKVVDTVNTAKDIAHVIWNVGWRR